MHGAKFIHTALSNPVNKNKSSKKNLATKKLFTRSLFASEDILPGMQLTEKNIRFKKPAGGLSFQDFSKLSGKKITKKVKCNEMLTLDHFK